MDRREAHEFLEAVQAGARATEKEITKALYLTGDLTRYRPEDIPPPQLVASPKWPFYATSTGRQPTQETP